MNDATKTPRIPRVRKTLMVKLAPEKAFRLFTVEVGKWWPLMTHSVGKAAAETAVLEGRVGGRFYERQRDGQIAIWGHVSVWEPPSRLVYTWHPGRAEDSAQEIELRFITDGHGTRIEMEHRNWETLGQKAREARDDYDKGWDYVLNECFMKVARGG